MSIRNLKEVDVQESGKFTLDGMEVNLTHVGKPITISFMEYAVLSEEKRSEKFKEEYDKGHTVEKGANVFVRGDPHSRGLPSDNWHSITYAVQFYKTD
ncbi:hypothetical protein HN747_02495 [archaeon]|jgi:hypothetical protein|nr:hypothetical protein [archaeon]